MDRASRHAILGAVILVVVALATWRERPTPVEAGRREPPPPAGAAPPSPPPGPVPAPGAPSADSVLAHLQQGISPPLPKDVLSGPLLAVGPGRTDPELPDLPLTPSQETIVRALLRARDEALDGIRREAALAPQTRERAELLASRAGRAQAVCMGSIRDCLLPDQQAAFDELRRTNKWGGYVLVIPTRP